MRAVMYLHGGSGNRGCEAIVRSTNSILRTAGFRDVEVLSESIDEDRESRLDKEVRLIANEGRRIEQIPIGLRAVAKLYNKLLDSEYLYYRLSAGRFTKYDFKGTVALSVGGDHYCYEGGEQILAFHNRQVRIRGGKSVLWGCSIEPGLITPRVKKDLQGYDAIFARESITYQALRRIGVKRAYLYPDPAFTLGFEETDFSEGMHANAVGINASTYAVGSKDVDSLGLQSYVELIHWIQDNTDWHIYLIPHVFKPRSNDLDVNRRILERLGSRERVIPVNHKYTAMQLKGIIRRCRFYVGARTHSTIAAYSSCVPTLVVGYSVKANGIARDLFDTENHYVVPVDGMKSEAELRDAFRWLVEHEDETLRRLEAVIPSYIREAWLAGEVLQKVIG